MLGATDLIELFDLVAARASTEYERASIARLVEVVGNDSSKWVAALAAHSLATVALSRDLDQHLREKLVHADSVLASSVSEVIADHRGRTEAATAALETAGTVASAATQALAEAAAAATRDISEARSQAVTEAARAALTELVRAIPDRLAAEAAKIAAVEGARLGKASQITAAIWAALGVGCGLVAPFLWRAI